MRLRWGNRDRNVGGCEGLKMTGNRSGDASRCWQRMRGRLSVRKVCQPIVRRLSRWRTGVRFSLDRWEDRLVVHSIIRVCLSVCLSAHLDKKKEKGPKEIDNVNVPRTRYTLKEFKAFHSRRVQRPWSRAYAGPWGCDT